MRALLFSLCCLGLLVQHPAYAVARPMLTGINIAGAEFAADKLPGVAGKDYLYPSSAILAAYASFGMNTVRVPFLWERIQPALGGPLAPEELQRLDAVVTEAKKLNLSIILDLHNYGAYRGELIGSKAVPLDRFIHVWKLLADHYQKETHVAFGIMNEPNKQDAAEWAGMAKAALLAIRSTGARQTVLVPGTLWSGAHSWNKKAGKRSNAEALAKLRDPANNLLIEFHHYFDYNYSGTHKECTPPAVTEEALLQATRWLKKTRHQGFLGEFGTAKDEACRDALKAALEHLHAHPKLWRGWAYWGASEWFGDYPFNVYPVQPEQFPQLVVLKNALNR